MFLLVFIGLRKWIWVLGRFVGCGLENVCVVMLESVLLGSEMFFVLYRNIWVRCLSIVSLVWKVLFCFVIIICGLVVSGWVLMVVMKIELGLDLGLGILLNGWVCSVVYRFDCNRLLWICLVFSVVSLLVG